MAGKITIHSSRSVEQTQNVEQHTTHSIQNNGPLFVEVDDDAVVGYKKRAARVELFPFTTSLILHPTEEPK